MSDKTLEERARAFEPPHQFTEGFHCGCVACMAEFARPYEAALRELVEAVRSLKPKFGDIFVVAKLDEALAKAEAVLSEQGGEVMGFKKGDRVKIAIEKAYWNVRHPDRLGTVTRVSQWKHYVVVLWDGRKTDERYYPQFLTLEAK